MNKTHSLIRMEDNPGYEIKKKNLMSKCMCRILGFPHAIYSWSGLENLSGHYIFHLNEIMVVTLYGVSMPCFIRLSISVFAKYSNQWHHQRFVLSGNQTHTGPLWTLLCSLLKLISILQQWQRKVGIHLGRDTGDSYIANQRRK